MQPNPGNTQWQFSNLFTDQRGVGTSGFDYASFLLGLPRSLTYFIYPDYFRTRGSIYALFVQDDIRVSRKLTLNIGLRWDAPLWFHEKLNRTGVFDIDKGVYNQLGTNGFRDTPWQQDWKNFGPRFGFAYSPFGRDKTVIRGGYGLFSVGTSRSLRESFMELSPLFAEADGGKYTSTDSVNWRTTLDNVPFTPSGKTGAGYLAVNIYPDKNPMAYVQQWNTNVSHEFRGVLVEVGYAGSHGVHLPIGNNAIGGYNVNTIPLRLATQARGQFIAPYVTYPQYPNGVTVRTWIGNSIYHSLQTKVEKRFGGGFGVLAAYTWQKTIASEDGNFRDPVANRRMDRGLEGNSVPQRLSVAWNYEPLRQGTEMADRRAAGLSLRRLGDQRHHDLAVRVPADAGRELQQRPERRHEPAERSPRPGAGSFGADPRPLVRRVRLRIAGAIHRRQLRTRTDLRPWNTERQSEHREEILRIRQ